MTHVSIPNGDTKIELQTSNHHPTPPESLRQDSLDQDFQRTSTNQDINNKNNRPRQAYAKKAGFISLLHFFFVVKLVRFINSLKGRSITEEDLKPLVYSWRCQPMENLFTQYYYEFRTKYQGQVKLIAKVLFEIFKREIYIQIFWQIVYICARILIPYFLFLSLTSLRNPLDPLADAYKPAIGMFICFLVSHYSFHQWNFNAAFASNAAKIGLLGMLFRKINKISLLSLQKLSFGKVINVAANDANNLENMHYMFFIPLLPLSYGGAIVLLVYWWGASGLVPIGYMMMINVYQYFMSQKVITPGRQRSFFADERIRKIFEILESIRIVKMQTWESYFIDEIYKTRAIEIGGLKKVNYLVSFIRAVTYSSQYIAAFLLLVTYNQVSGPITSAKIFPSILLLGFLKQFAMIYCQVGFIYSVLLLSISLRTISIMDLPEVRPEKEILSPESPENSVEFRDFSGYWTKKDLGEPPFIKPPPPNPPKPAPPEASISPTPAVSKINLDIKTGELVAIVGQTGAGKSSLLLSFTREMIKTEGELRFAGTLDYVAQEPIVLSLSIKESISYGKKYDDELFWKVVDACCLKDMIDSLPKKELTQMAERGVNLSEVQKIQITLARALYSKADIYLLDDPFSSFDQRLGKLIFRKAIQEFLKDSTVILVTHNLNFVKHANKIVIMQAGSIIAQGTYSELAQKETSSKIIEELQRRVKYEKRDLESFGQGRQYDEVYNPLLGRGESAMKERPVAEDETAIDLVEDDNGLFIEDERLDDGKVTLKIYWAYIRTVFNWWNCIPLIILFAAPEAAGWQFMLRVSDWLLGDYSDSEAYGILAAIAFGALIVHLIKYLLYYTFGLNGVKKLHNKMLRGIMHSPMKFFDRNRIGRIINRFANDISQLDRFLLPAFIDILEGICYFTIYLIALWLQELWILIPAGIAFVGFMITFLYFRKSINAARGLELTVRGPVYSFFSSVFNGATIFRVRDQTENIMKAFYRRADDYARANVAYKTTLRLQSFVLDYITELTVIGTYCFYISQKGNTIVNGTFVNMLISLPTTMQWLLRNFAAFHAMMAATARIINYCQNYKGVEMVKSGDEKLKQSGWPHGGEIDIKDANMRYGEKKPLVIKNLNAQIKPGEKVAVVGPSSFGMTSIINMITRVLHIEPKPDAHVNIDGVSVKDIGVTLNRRSMTIITQQYYVFTGTIRQNIDPCKKHSDDEIWNALDVAGLKEHIEALDAKLDTYFVRGSSLFSAGQRQMLSLARALLKKDTSILIQDRATNHVDIVTDHLLQKKLKERYANSTTVMTTFRLWHVAECDRVLCMKNGIKTEFDEPYRLLVKEIGDKEITNKHGHFARLVLDMNPKIVKQTFKIAMIAYYKRHNMPLNDVPGGVEVSGPYGEAKDVTILEEERQIQGDWEDIELIRRASSKPILQAAKRDLLV